MIGSQRSGVFLSYARADGKQFAASLRERLRQKAPDIDIKQDRILLEGGVGWCRQRRRRCSSFFSGSAFLTGSVDGFFRFFALLRAS